MPHEHAAESRPQPRADPFLDQTLSRRPEGGGAFARDPWRYRVGTGRNLRRHRQHCPARRRDVERLGALAAAGLIGYAGNWLAAIVRTNAGRALDSPALVADGNHAKADAYVSLAVVVSAAAMALGLQLADPLIGLGISVLIMRITWQSWRTVRDGNAH
jgi:divalent metal cation (Fe/Co/Zn/Cd) transporter